MDRKLGILKFRLRKSKVNMAAIAEQKKILFLVAQALHECTIRIHFKRASLHEYKPVVLHTVRELQENIGADPAYLDQFVGVVTSLKLPENGRALPKHEGLNIYSIVREKDPNKPVIFWTGTPNDVDLRHAIGSGKAHEDMKCCVIGRTEEREDFLCMASFIREPISARDAIDARNAERRLSQQRRPKLQPN